DVAEAQDAAFDQAREKGQLAEHGLQRANASLAALEEAARALAAPTDVEVAQRTVLQSLGRHLLFDRAALFLLDEGRQVLVGAASFGVSPDTTARMKKHEEPAAPEKSELAKAMRGEAPVVLADEPIRSTSLGAFWLTLSTRELLAAPLLHRGRPVGLLLADNSVTGRPFAEEDKNLLASIASLLATGAENLKREKNEREKTSPRRMVE
ncbi:MAG TPA: GAF domain-containing protein, partial [Thermoanaerobaculia bacterium]|nr:GAF domain-containing protein [Thermoanaerobaculia bacterium]